MTTLSSFRSKVGHKDLGKVGHIQHWAAKGHQAPLLLQWRWNHLLLLLTIVVVEGVIEGGDEIGVDVVVRKVLISLPSISILETVFSSERISCCLIQSLILNFIMDNIVEVIRLCQLLLHVL